MDGNTFDDSTEVATRSELDDGGRSDVTLIATQREDIRNRPVIDSVASGLQNFFQATVQLMVMARACGHDSLAGFERRDLTSWKRDIAELTCAEYAGVGKRPSVSEQDDRTAQNRGHATIGWCR